MGKLLLGAAAMALLLCRPEAAVNGAREGLRQWYFAVAPSLFPFMALMPLITCREAMAVYGRALGGVTRRLYDLPGGAACALVAGMAAGSPAGCAAARTAARAGMDRGQLTRLAVACGGLSPGFFVSAVGAVLLDDPALGRLLLRSQIAAQLLMPWLLRPLCRDGAPVTATDDPRPVSPVAAILGVAGWMALFGALAQAVGVPWLGGLLEITAGARMICRLPWGLDARLAALSALAGFGGACLCAQNIGALRGSGVSPVRFVCLRMLTGLAAAGITLAQLHADWIKSIHFQMDMLPAACIIAAACAIPAMIGLKRTII